MENALVDELGINHRFCARVEQRCQLTEGTVSFRKQLTTR